jgi:hypothetical protein
LDFSGGNYLAKKSRCLRTQRAPRKGFAQRSDCPRSRTSSGAPKDHLDEFEVPPSRKRSGEEAQTFHRQTNRTITGIVAHPMSISGALSGWLPPLPFCTCISSPLSWRTPPVVSVLGTSTACHVPLLMSSMRAVCRPPLPSRPLKTRAKAWASKYGAILTLDQVPDRHPHPLAA